MKNAATSVAILFSIHHVLKAEKLLLEKGLSHDVVPVPREISGDCGMALVFASSDLDAVRGIFHAARIAIARIFRREADGSYTEVKWNDT